ncbi:MAG: hypothetical protein COA94_07340 [Rickettsiales bacterium]|nr:MAG: hypothetical protein COA94_07340 [Rickettsiales bacterium]
MSRSSNSENITISTVSVAYMVAQIRAKQLASKASQDELLRHIVEYLESEAAAEITGASFATIMAELVETELKHSYSFEDLELVGYPIKYNKTKLILEMVQSWVSTSDDSLMADITNNTLHNGQGNTVLSELPRLQAPSQVSSWGNENPVVNTALLLIGASHFTQDDLTFTGAATFFPFFDPTHVVDGYSNIFGASNGMILVGDYQYGGHRYFSNPAHGLKQQLFGAEDCSSAVAKATGLGKYVVEVTTTSLREAYTSPKWGGHYTAITSTYQEEIDWAKVQPGDIYIRGGHTAIIASAPDQHGFETLEFNRDIESNTKHKLLGGGMYHRTTDPQGKDIYFLCQPAKDFKESCSATDLLQLIDQRYEEMYGDNVPVDVAGDCGIFLQL